MGLGSYWGSGIGALLGGGLGALGTYALLNSGYDGRGVSLPLVLGLAGGGALGGITGTTLGNMAAESPDHDSPAAQQRYLNDYAQAYAKKHDVSLEDAHADIQKLVRKKLDSKKKKQPQPKAKLNKAAGHEKASALPAVLGLAALEAALSAGSYAWGRYDGYNAAQPTTMQKIMPYALGGLAGTGLGALGYRAYTKRQQQKKQQQQQQQQAGQTALPDFDENNYATKFSSVSPYDIPNILASLIDNKGAARLPADYKALRQALISAGVGGTVGGIKGYMFPGYDEKLDDEGRVISKKKIKPWRGALQGAGIGAGTGALANYAGQVVSRYNPEIDQFLFGKS